MESFVAPTWAWALLGVVLFASLTIDLVVHRGDHAASKKTALVWSGVWIAVAVAFGIFVTLELGTTAGEQYFAAYLLEKALSLDNLFVFLFVFTAFGIPKTEQRRVLTWGIIGALVMRAGFIVAGAAALARWQSLTYVFGAFLVITAVKLARQREGQPPKLIHWLEKHLPWTRRLDGHHFLTRERGRRIATPLLAALIVIELVDVVFALDSVPAAFAVSTDTFILYSSNVFAILGLRALYIVLAGALERLHYLKYGLVAVLGFAGAKMLAASWVHVPPLASVLVIAGCIGVAAVASLARKPSVPAVTL